MVSYFTRSCHPDEGLHRGKESGWFSGFKWILHCFSCSCAICSFKNVNAERPDIARVSEEGPRYWRRHLFLGRLRQLVKTRIPLIAVNSDSCSRSCCPGDRWRACCWHKLDWWHVRLAFRSRKGTGPNFFWQCVWVSEKVCVCEGKPELSLCYSGWPLCVSLKAKVIPVVSVARGVWRDFTGPWAQ